LGGPSDLQDLILRPPEIPAEEYELVVDIVRGQGIPKMDKIGSCDPYIIVHFAGSQLRTEIKKDTLVPVWGEKLCLPITMPSLVDLIRIELWDNDVVCILFLFSFFDNHYFLG
jgi:hypothetical protein